MKIYFNNRQLIDYFVALAITAGVFFQSAFSFNIFIWPTGETLIEFCLGVATGSASLLGFVLAANTFLISHTQHKRLGMLRNSDGFSQLIDIMSSNLWRLLVLTFTAGLCSLVTPPFSRYALCGVLFILVLTGMALATLIWSTMAVLSIRTESSN